MGFRLDISGVLRGLVEVEIKTRAALGIYGDVAAKKLEAEAKKNAKWVDRTGNARQTIKGVSGWKGFSADISIARVGESNSYRVDSVSKKDGGGSKMVVAVTGNMNYSPYLELCNEKRFAILAPTIEKMTPEILQGMRGILR